MEDKIFVSRIQKFQINLFFISDIKLSDQKILLNLLTFFTLNSNQNKQISDLRVRRHTWRTPDASRKMRTLFEFCLMSSILPRTIASFIRFRLHPRFKSGYFIFLPPVDAQAQIADYCEEARSLSVWSHKLTMR